MSKREELRQQVVAKQKNAEERANKPLDNLGFNTPEDIEQRKKKELANREVGMWNNLLFQFDDPEDATSPTR